MSNKNLTVNTQMGIQKPAKDVFEAIVNPEKMSKYFITTSTGRMKSGKTLIWTWEDYGVEHDIKVKKVDKDKFISFKWSASGIETLVEFTLEEKGENKTLIKVKESEWQLDEEGVERILGQTQGWVNMLCCL